MSDLLGPPCLGSDLKPGIEQVELLTVEHTSWLERPGVQMLIIYPDFRIPRGWKERGWIRRTESVLVVRPNGSEIAATAMICMTHLSIRGPALVEDRWRITMWLTNRTVQEVPVGSRVLVPREVRDAILPDNVA
jgi:hypothetical protein